jgi:spore germination protein GerM
MKKTFCIFICSITIFSAISLTGCDNKDIISSNNKDKEKEIALSNQKENTLDLNVYFQSSDASNSSDVSKEERIIKKDELVGEAIVNELIKGPSVKSSLKPVLPKESKLLSFSIKDNIAYVSFSKETNIVMTAVKEEICLKSIILSVTELSSVQKVKILIENKDTGLWGDHFDLSKPLGKDNIISAKKNKS